MYRCEMDGAGGFTKVVALKLLTESPEADPEGLLKRLRDEARILGLLRHRAVIHADSLVLTNAGWATVMEYVEGVDLTTIEKSRIPIRPVLEIVEEIASALDGAWNQPRPDGQPLNLVHRDIKPPNIRITLRGEVKLLDFGIARADLDQRESHTASVMLGTLKFMAPERLDGIEGPQGDVYSLGLVTARMVLGRALPMPPRRAESHLAMLRELRDELAVRLAADQPSLAADMTRLVLRMLDYDPAGRPTAAAIAERCRLLMSQADGPWLREWAPEALPPILHEGEQTMDDPRVGTTLTEMTDAVARLLPKEHIPIVRLDVFSSQNVLLPDEEEDDSDPLSAGTPQSERALGALIATITLTSLATLAATAWSLLAPATPINVSYAAPTAAHPVVAHEVSVLPAPTVAEGTAKPRIVRKKSRTAARSRGQVSGLRSEPMSRS